MKQEQTIREWLLDLPKRGRVTFSLDEVNSHFPFLTDRNKRIALWRMVEAGKIQSVWNGFYVIVPIEYELKGIVPPIVYIDQLMTYLQKDYYVGLLNAAMFYGAAHQQPQEFTVVVGGKSLRDKQKNGVKINFVSKKEIHFEFIRKNTTKTGYVSVSSPELTAFDLMLYQKEVGSLSRVCTVLNELIDEMDFEKITLEFLQLFPASIVQRFGYILDKVLERDDKAKVFLDKTKQAGVKFRKTPLKSDIHFREPSEYPQDKIWKVVINEYIEIDE